MAAQIGRYAHARQFKRMRKTLKALRIRVGRVYREVTRKLAQLPEQARHKARDLLHRVGRILTQKTRDKNKLYALHAPEAECISKGKARTPYEFGVKVSIATLLSRRKTELFSVDYLFKSRLDTGNTSTLIKKEILPIT